MINIVFTRNLPSSPVCRRLGVEWRILSKCTRTSTDRGGPGDGVLRGRSSVSVPEQQKNVSVQPERGVTAVSNTEAGLLYDFREIPLESRP